MISKDRNLISFRLSFAVLFSVMLNIFIPFPALFFTTIPCAVNAQTQFVFVNKIYTERHTVSIPSSNLSLVYEDCLFLKGLSVTTAGVTRIIHLRISNSNVTNGGLLMSDVIMSGGSLLITNTTLDSVTVNSFDFSFSEVILNRVFLLPKDVELPSQTDDSRGILKFSDFSSGNFSTLNITESTFASVQFLGSVTFGSESSFLFKNNLIDTRGMSNNYTVGLLFSDCTFSSLLSTHSFIENNIQTDVGIGVYFTPDAALPDRYNVTFQDNIVRVFGDPENVEAIKIYYQAFTAEYDDDASLSVGLIPFLSQENTLIGGAWVDASGVDSHTNLSILVKNLTSVTFLTLEMGEVNVSIDSCETTARLLCVFPADNSTGKKELRSFSITDSKFSNLTIIQMKGGELFLSNVELLGFENPIYNSKQRSRKDIILVNCDIENVTLVDGTYSNKYDDFRMYVNSGSNIKKLTVDGWVNTGGANCVFDFEVVIPTFIAGGLVCKALDWELTGYANLKLVNSKILNVTFSKWKIEKTERVEIHDCDINSAVFTGLQLAAEAELNITGTTFRFLQFHNSTLEPFSRLFFLIDEVKDLMSFVEVKLRSSNATIDIQNCKLTKTFFDKSSLDEGTISITNTDFSWSDGMKYGNKMLSFTGCVSMKGTMLFLFVRNTMSCVYSTCIYFDEECALKETNILEFWGNTINSHKDAYTFLLSQNATITPPILSGTSFNTIRGSIKVSAPTVNLDEIVFIDDVIHSAELTFQSVKSVNATNTVFEDLFELHLQQPGTVKAFVFEEVTATKFAVSSPKTNFLLLRFYKTKFHDFSMKARFVTIAEISDVTSIGTISRFHFDLERISEQLVFSNTTSFHTLTLGTALGSGSKAIFEENNLLQINLGLNLLANAQVQFLRNIFHVQFLWSGEIKNSTIARGTRIEFLGNTFKGPAILRKVYFREDCILRVESNIWDMSCSRFCSQPPCCPKAFSLQQSPMLAGKHQHFIRDNHVMEGLGFVYAADSSLPSESQLTFENNYVNPQVQSTEMAVELHLELGAELLSSPFSWNNTIVGGSVLIDAPSFRRASHPVTLQNVEWGSLYLRVEQVASISIKNCVFHGHLHILVLGFGTKLSSIEIVDVELKAETFHMEEGTIMFFLGFNSDVTSMNASNIKAQQMNITVGDAGFVGRLNIERSEVKQKLIVVVPIVQSAADIKNNTIGSELSNGEENEAKHSILQLSTESTCVVHLKSNVFKGVLKVVDSVFNMESELFLETNTFARRLEISGKEAAFQIGSKLTLISNAFTCNMYRNNNEEFAAVLIDTPAEFNDMQVTIFGNKFGKECRKGGLLMEQLPLDAAGSFNLSYNEFQTDAKGLAFSVRILSADVKYSPPFMLDGNTFPGKGGIKLIASKISFPTLPILNHELGSVTIHLESIPSSISIYKTAFSGSLTLSLSGIGTNLETFLIDECRVQEAATITLGTASNVSDISIKSSHFLSSFLFRTSGYDALTSAVLWKSVSVNGVATFVGGSISSTLILQSCTFFSSMTLSSVSMSPNTQVNITRTRTLGTLTLFNFSLAERTLLSLEDNTIAILEQTLTTVTGSRVQMIASGNSITKKMKISNLLVEQPQSGNASFVIINNNIHSLQCSICVFEAEEAEFKITHNDFGGGSYISLFRFSMAAHSIIHVQGNTVGNGSKGEGFKWTQGGMAEKGVIEISDNSFLGGIFFDRPQLQNNTLLSVQNNEVRCYNDSITKALYFNFLELNKYNVTHIVRNNLAVGCPGGLVYPSSSPLAKESVLILQNNSLEVSRIVEYSAIAVYLEERATMIPMNPFVGGNDFRGSVILRGRNFDTENMPIVGQTALGKLELVFRSCPTFHVVNSTVLGSCVFEIAKNGAYKEILFQSTQFHDTIRLHADEGGSVDVFTMDNCRSYGEFEVDLGTAFASSKNFSILSSTFFGEVKLSLGKIEEEILILDSEINQMTIEGGHSIASRALIAGNMGNLSSSSKGTSRMILKNVQLLPKTSSVFTFENNTFPGVQLMNISASQVLVRNNSISKEIVLDSIDLSIPNSTLTIEGNHGIISAAKQKCQEFVILNMNISTPFSSVVIQNNSEISEFRCENVHQNSDAASWNVLGNTMDTVQMVNWNQAANDGTLNVQDNSFSKLRFESCAFGDDLTHNFHSNAIAEEISWNGVSFGNSSRIAMTGNHDSSPTITFKNSEFGDFAELNFLSNNLEKFSFSDCTFSENSSLEITDNTLQTDGTAISFSKTLFHMTNHSMFLSVTNHSITSNRISGRSGGVVYTEDIPLSGNSFLILEDNVLNSSNGKAVQLYLRENASLIPPPFACRNEIIGDVHISAPDLHVAHLDIVARDKLKKVALIFGSTGNVTMKHTRADTFSLNILKKSEDTSGITNVSVLNASFTDELTFVTERNISEVKFEKTQFAKQNTLELFHVLKSVLFLQSSLPSSTATFTLRNAQLAAHLTFEIRNCALNGTFQLESITANKGTLVRIAGNDGTGLLQIKDWNQAASGGTLNVQDNSFSKLRFESCAFGDDLTHNFHSNAIAEEISWNGVSFGNSSRIAMTGNHDSSPTITFKNSEFGDFAELNFLSNNLEKFSFSDCTFSENSSLEITGNTLQTDGTAISFSKTLFHMTNHSITSNRISGRSGGVVYTEDIPLSGSSFLILEDNVLNSSKGKAVQLYLRENASLVPPPFACRNEIIGGVHISAPDLQVETLSLLKRRKLSDVTMEIGAVQRSFTVNETEISHSFKLQLRPSPLQADALNTTTRNSSPFVMLWKNSFGGDVTLKNLNELEFLTVSDNTVKGHLFMELALMKGNTSLRNIAAGKLTIQGGSSPWSTVKKREFSLLSTPSMNLSGELRIVISNCSTTTGELKISNFVLSDYAIVSISESSWKTGIYFESLKMHDWSELVFRDISILSAPHSVRLGGSSTLNDYSHVSVFSTHALNGGGGGQLDFSALDLSDESQLCVVDSIFGDLKFPKVVKNLATVRIIKSSFNQSSATPMLAYVRGSGRIFLQENTFSKKLTLNCSDDPPTTTRPSHFLFEKNDFFSNSSACGPVSNSQTKCTSLAACNKMLVDGSLSALSSKPCFPDLGCAAVTSPQCYPVNPERCCLRFTRTPTLSKPSYSESKTLTLSRSIPSTISSSENATPTTTTAFSFSVSQNETPSTSSTPSLNASNTPSTSTTLSLNFTSTFELPRGVAEMVQSVTTLAVLLSGPGAMDSQTMLALGLMPCASPAARALAKESLWLICPWELGTEGSSVSLASGNMAILFIVAFVHISMSFLLHHAFLHKNMTQNLNFPLFLAKLRVPSMEFIVLQMGLQGIAVMSFFGLWTDTLEQTNIGLRVLAAIYVIFLGLFIATGVFLVFFAVPQVAFIQFTVATAKYPPFLRKFVLPIGFWDEVNPLRCAISSLLSIIQKEPSLTIFVLLPFTKTIVTSLVVSLPGSVPCLPRLIILALFYCTLAAAVMYKRPFRILFLNYMSVVQLLLTAFCTLGQLGDDGGSASWAIGALITLSSILSIATRVVAFSLTRVEAFFWVGMELKLAPQSEENTKLLSLPLLQSNLNRKGGGGGEKDGDGGTKKKKKKTTSEGEKDSKNNENDEMLELNDEEMRLLDMDDNEASAAATTTITVNPLLTSPTMNNYSITTSGSETAMIGGGGSGDVMSSFDMATSFDPFTSRRESTDGNTLMSNERRELVKETAARRTANPLALLSSVDDEF